MSYDGRRHDNAPFLYIYTHTQYLPNNNNVQTLSLHKCFLTAPFSSSFARTAKSGALTALLSPVSCALMPTLVLPK